MDFCFFSFASFFVNNLLSGVDWENKIREETEKEVNTRIEIVCERQRLRIK